MTDPLGPPADTTAVRPTRHILSLSGGKDSTALAIYMKDRVPEMEYFFCDTGEELRETYAYLAKLEAFLGRSITRLNPDRPFLRFGTPIARTIRPIGKVGTSDGR